MGSQYSGRTVLITGGTGSLGQALTRRLLNTDVKSIRILSRNESKQVEMEKQFDDSRIRYFIGDVRDSHRLSRAMEGVDIVFHAAALKHVPIIEYNPFEAVHTNVMGSQKVIDACIDADVEIAVGIGTDKAVSPLNAYGATKLLMEKLFVTAKNYLDKKKHRTKFLALRYGNVLGSSGSVVPLFIDQIRKQGKITVTDCNMTRFSITMDEALDFILRAVSESKGSEIFVPKLRAYTIEDLKKALFDLVGESEEEIISIRPGEKLHETLINSEEMRYTWKYGKNFVILNSALDEDYVYKTYPNIKKVSGVEPYSSDLVEKIPVNELKSIIKSAGLLANGTE